MRILICEEMHFKKFKFPDWKYAHARFGVLCSVCDEKRDSVYLLLQITHYLECSIELLFFGEYH